MKRREWSGKRLLTLILALALAMSSFNVPVRASEAQTETVWEEKKEEQTEPVEQEEPEKEEPEKEEPTEPANPEEPEKELRKLTIHCEDPEGQPSQTLSASADPEEVYEGTEVKITVRNSGSNIWAAEVTAEGRELEVREGEDSLVFEMPAVDVDVRIYELKSQNREELSGEDSSIPGDFQGNQALTKKENEPDMELEKSVRWTDIEDGYAELTITEKDTSDYSNLPADYIIILDRTRTMSLSDIDHEDSAGSHNYMGYHSPCINPAHDYYKGGIYLHMLDYDTGFDYRHDVWIDDLRNMEFWNRHYDQNGAKIMPTAENGCYDRLSMAKQGIRELVDMIEAQNAQVSGGALRSRVAFWSFADEYRRITGDKRDQGLYNYTPLTENYDQVRQAVNAVKTYSGTYYLASLKEAYDIITTRNATDSRRKNVYTKVIFISDGECETDLAKVKATAAQIRSLPNTELFTLAIGMTAESGGARLLREIAGSADHTANFWQTLSFDGGNGSAFAKTLLNIEKKASEVKAVQKTLTDQIETKYWEPVEVLSADGGQATLDKNSGKLIWNVPEGAGKTYRCTVKLRLKDAYRYALSEALYPTNRDQSRTDPDKAGAILDYSIDGGMYHQQTRKTGVLTPTLKYGTVHFKGQKYWTVTGSQAASLNVRLMRTLPGQTTAIQVNHVLTNGSRGWRYSFTRRAMPDGSEKPLIRYDERGRKITYQVTERTPDYFTQLPSVETEGAEVETRLYNEPFKIKAQLKKVDRETGNPLSGAEFSVYCWSRKAGSYQPYQGTTDGTGQPYETGSMHDSPAMMKLKETEPGVYQTPSWLYYAPDNQGKFRIVETQAPKGYYGDWKTETEKQSYDVVISANHEDNKKTVQITNNQSGTFENQRVLGRVLFCKNDAEGKSAISQGDASLSGATYKLCAGEELRHGDGTTGVLYRKDEEIPLRLIGSRDGVRQYRQDPSGTDTLIIGTGCQVSIENLELGSYYLREQTAGEGYLVNPEPCPFTLEWQGEAVQTVEIRDIRSDEPVKKQKLTFYKVAGTDRTDRLDPLEGAGFSVYLLSEFAGGRYKELSDADVVQAVIDDFRDGQALDYRAVRAFCPARVFAEAESAEVKAGKLVKQADYGAGCHYETEHDREYLVGELFSDSRGQVTTPGLPYGRYLVVETTVPKNRIATRPFVIQVTGDDEDGVSAGDGLGKKLEDLVILQDRPVSALVRVEKVDAWSGRTIQKEGAAYVIHDTEGAWFSYYTAEWSTARKKDYKKKYGDLVVQYSQGNQLGTEANPFVTRKRGTPDGTESFWVDTPSPLPAGVYELQEVSAPDGYILQGHEGVIAKKETGTTGNHTFYETEKTGTWKPVPEGRVKFLISSGEAVYDAEAGAFVVKVRQKNTPAIGKIAVYAEGEQLVSAKSGREGWSFVYGKKPVSGAVFEIRAAEAIYSQEGAAGELLYPAGERVVTLTTDENGQTWTGQEDWAGTEIARGLPLGVYTVTQVKAGEGFALSPENAKPRRIEIAYAGQEVPVIYRDTVYENPRQRVRLTIEKQDTENGKQVVGAVFGLYAAKDILDYRGRLLVKKDTLLGQAQTAQNSEGKIEQAVFSQDLPLGSYYVKEVQAPDGYAGSAIRVNADASYREDQREEIHLKGVVKNTPIRVQINLMDWFTEAELSGSTLQVTDEAGRVVETFVTRADQNPVIRRLEIGKKYLVKELVKPAGYGEGLLLKAAYETEKEDSVELDKRYPAGKEEREIRFTVRDETKLQVVSIFAKPGMGTLEITKEGPVPVRTEGSVDAAGNRLETPVYEVQGLPGAEYVLQAQKEIPYPDGRGEILFAKQDLVLECYEAQKETGSMQYFTIEVTEGKMVQAERTLPDGAKAQWVLRTGENGKAEVTGLPDGSYRVVEVKAPTGYYRDPANCTQMADVRGATALRFENPKQEIEKPGIVPDPNPEAPRHIGMLVQKYGVEDEKQMGVSGAAFTLYAAEDIQNIFGQVIYPEGTEIETAFSGTDGLTRFVTDVPIGLYRIRETKAPEGYYSSTKEIWYDVAKDKENDSVHYLNFWDFVENTPVIVNVRLEDDLTHKELAGAALEITDEAGQSVDAWITRVDNGYTIRGLSVDKSYTITEHMPRDGYLMKFTGARLESANAELSKPEGAQVTFRIQDVPGETMADGKIDREAVPEPTRIILESPFVTGRIRLNKEGEILDGLTMTERIGNLLAGVFHYRRTGLEGVSFAVYAAEDIEHPDGVTGICFRKGEQVMTGVRSELKEAAGKTDSLGQLSFEELYLGQYEIREQETVEGYVREENPLFLTLAYRDGFTSPVEPQQGLLSWLNPRQKAEVTVNKRDKDTGEALEGAEISLYLKETDTLLETVRTSADGRAIFIADLPFGSYYIKETKAPEGYQLSEDKQEFTFAYAGEDRKLVQVEKTLLNEKKPEQRASHGKSRQVAAAPMGDRAQMEAWGMLLVLAAGLLLLITVRRRNRN
ncbi:SpaA isopeptide-forming pilin-related protein [Candidatus Merdisoma sp. HCP28S3_D10]|uniref:SpaA isopeptide-forming pilin-related protein n=1 Tax=unclassified Candidatus Merdisoma TaxID=3099611 RepID=UPI003F8CBAF7